MDMFFYFVSMLILIQVCQKVKSEDERAQNGPSEDSLRMYKYLQLYQKQQQLSNSEAAPYANRLSSGYYPQNPTPQRELSDEDKQEDELYHNPHRWNAAANPQRSRNKGLSYPWYPLGQAEVVPDREIKSEVSSGFISAQVYPPQEEIPKYEDKSTQIISETEPNTLRTELLYEEKKSPQAVHDPEGVRMFYAVDGPLPQRFASEDTAKIQKNPFSDIYFIVIVAGCSAAAIFGVIAAGYCFYKFQKTSKAAAEVDYPAYGVTGPNKEHNSPSGDRKLAHSAQMYHYQHQKQQMIAVENATTNRQASNSDVDSEEENEEGDYTVYECPGLAPTGEMEVKNPLFHDDSTPMSPPVAPKEMKKP